MPRLIGASASRRRYPLAATQRRRPEAVLTSGACPENATPDPATRRFSGEVHEHSCLRCPLLRPDPAERSRLVEIRDNLTERISEADSKGWLGEAEGLRVSLDGAREKLAQMDLIAERRATAVNLGMPGFAEAAGRTTTATLRRPPNDD